jgi:cation diffusion facilitator family transporter
VIALIVGIVLLASKFYAWRLTDSQTVFSDAMESIVNVAAAAIALFAISFAARPADDDHPYGHGKIEFVTAGFEGGLIAFAGLTIVYEAISALIVGHEPKKLDFGIGIVAAAGVANLLLGLFLLRTGRRHRSPALQADGHHVISDFWTSAGAVVGLVLVRLTGLAWIDATTAVLFALLLFWTGGKMLRQAARGLLDETDPGVIDEIAAALEAARTPGIIEVHDLRAINVGDRRHVDLHAVVPEFWTVDRSHAEMDAYELRVREAHPPRVELQFHVDPCERTYCARCDLADCAVRTAPFRERRPITGESVVRGPESVAASARAPAG